MLVEYKPFEPAFYHTDIGDWGMALEFARSAGPQAKVLVGPANPRAAKRRVRASTRERSSFGRIRPITSARVIRARPSAKA